MLCKSFRMAQDRVDAEERLQELDANDVRPPQHETPPPSPPSSPREQLPPITWNANIEVPIVFL
jgi:hypothetical protein